MNATSPTPMTLSHTMYSQSVCCHMTWNTMTAAMHTTQSSMSRGYLNLSAKSLRWVFFMRALRIPEKASVKRRFASDMLFSMSK